MATYYDRCRMALTAVLAKRRLICPHHVLQEDERFEDLAGDEDPLQIMMEAEEALGLRLDEAPGDEELPTVGDWLAFIAGLL